MYEMRGSACERGAFVFLVEHTSVQQWQQVPAQ